MIAAPAPEPRHWYFSGSMAAPPTPTFRQRFLNAARRQPVDRPPVWLMRQAGRYLAEYREARAGRAFLDLVRSPEIAADITCQPIRRFDLDAAIIFSDILVPFAAMGLDVSFVEGVGPRIDPPVRTRAAVERLEAFDPEEKTGFLGRTIGLVRRELGPSRPIIGFCGGPFTMAAYAVEGGASPDYARTLGLLREDPATFDELLARIVDATIPYLGMQALAGADALQIFDTWAGLLDAASWRRAVKPALERLVTCAKAFGVPVIVYAKDAGHLLDGFAECAPDVLSLDPRVDGRDAVRRFGSRFALQGNLDPAALVGPPEAAGKAATDVLTAFRGAPGYVFNVGAGLTPESRPESVAAVVEAVRGWRPPA
jgi:uroporphyrinogen decarboxylase